MTYLHRSVFTGEVIDVDAYIEGLDQGMRLASTSQAPQPAPRRTVPTLVLAVLTFVVAGLFLGIGGPVHADHFGGAYGISVGTDTHYCSADLVHWRPEISCEVAQ